MGFTSFKGNQFWDRTLLFISDPNRRPFARYIERVPFGVVLGFTFIQLLCWAIIFGVTSSKTPAAISFPVFILLLVPLRWWLIPRIPCFKKEWLHWLDADSALDFKEDEGDNDNEVEVDLEVDDRREGDTVATTNEGENEDGESETGEGSDGEGGSDEGETAACSCEVETDVDGDIVTDDNNDIVIIIPGDNYEYKE